MPTDAWRHAIRSLDVYLENNNVIRRWNWKIQYAPLTNLPDGSGGNRDNEAKVMPWNREYGLGGVAFNVPVGDEE